MQSVSIEVSMQTDDSHSCARVINQKILVCDPIASYTHNVYILKGCGSISFDRVGVSLQFDHRYGCAMFKQKHTSINCIQDAPYICMQAESMKAKSFFFIL